MRRLIASCGVLVACSAGCHSEVRPTPGPTSGARTSAATEGPAPTSEPAATSVPVARPAEPNPEPPPTAASAELLPLSMNSGETLFDEARGDAATRDYLAAAMRAHARGPAAPTPASSLFRGRLGEGDSRHFDVRAMPGACYEVVLQGGLGVTDIDLALVRQSDLREIERGVETDLSSTLGASRTLCPTTATTYLVQVELVRGHGELAIQVFRLP